METSDVFKQIAELSFVKIVGWLLGFLAVLGPGFLMIVTFKPEWLVQLDGYKLTMLALSLVGPLFFTAFLVASWLVKSPPQTYSLHVSIMAATLSTACFYPALYLAKRYHLSFWTYLFVLGAAFVLSIYPARKGYETLMKPDKPPPP